MLTIAIEYKDGDKYVANVTADCMDVALATALDDLMCTCWKEVQK